MPPVINNLRGGHTDKDTDKHTHAHMQTHTYRHLHRNNFKELGMSRLPAGLCAPSFKVCKQVRDQIVWKQVQDTAQGLL